LKSQRLGNALANARLQSAPVLKLPPDLALPAIRVLASAKGPEERHQQLVKLRPTIPPRTLLNAYVLPSLKELRLYGGTLRDGSLTRFGEAVAKAAEENDEKGAEVLARQLVALDHERVGFVDWLVSRSRKGNGESQRTVLTEFLRDTTSHDEAPSPAALDRLGKWVGYLVFFRVLRGDSTAGTATSLGVDPRHVKALSEAPGPLPRASVLRDGLLEAYADSMRKVGTQLYIPIALLRDELGDRLLAQGVLLTDAQIDAILRRAPQLLRGYAVTFSPFSGPSRGGLKLAMMYAGFVSVRRGRGASRSRKRQG